MRRAGWLLVLVVLAGALLFPVQGKVWSPSQIQSATMDGQPVEPSRHGQLFWDAQRSRLGGPPSKCMGFATLVLKDGSRLEVRLSQSLALQHWPGCGL